MSNFSNLIRSKCFEVVDERPMLISTISAQFNPDRFHYWKALYTGPKGQVLNMGYSPHLRFLKHYTEFGRTNIHDTAYYQLQTKYGRKPSWIYNKIDGFIHLFEALKANPVLSGDNRIIVMQEPLVTNVYNSGCEVFEGHHRLACLLAMGVLETPVIIKVAR